MIITVQSPGEQLTYRRMFIDTHAHLNYGELQKDIDPILSRARDAGVEQIIVPATSLASSFEVIELVEKHEMLFGAVGIHPTELNGFDESHMKQIEDICTSGKIVAIGEIGLDYYWEPYDAGLQKHVLRSQFQIAKSKNLPVIIHNRKSSDDLMKLVEEEYDNGKLIGQFHSFSGDTAMSAKCIQMGFYISFTGNITYKPNASTLIAYDVLRSIPVTKLLLETDTPYLPPVPHRGKTNEPSYVAHTAEKIAQLIEITADKLGEITSNNARNLYRLPN